MVFHKRLNRARGRGTHKLSFCGLQNFRNMGWRAAGAARWALVLEITGGIAEQTKKIVLRNVELFGWELNFFHAEKEITHSSG
jgi:hypothetical protein